LFFFCVFKVLKFENLCRVAMLYMVIFYARLPYQKTLGKSIDASALFVLKLTWAKIIIMSI